MSQQPEALAATCDLLVQQFTAFGADKKAVKEALTASAATIRTLRAQVERLQAGGENTARAFIEWCKAQPEDRVPVSIDEALNEFEAALATKEPK